MHFNSGFNVLPSGLRLRHLLIALVGVGLLAVLAPAPVQDGRGSRAPAPAGAASIPARQVADDTGNVGAVLGGKRDAFSLQGVADLFSSTSWLPPPPAAVATKPVVPAFPFHFVGTLADDNSERQVYLAQHGAGVIVTPKVGDLLAGAFKVESVNGESLSLLYVPLSEKLTVSFASMGPEPGVRQSSGVAQAPEPASMAGSVRAVVGGSGPVASLPPIAGLGSAAPGAIVATGAVPAAAGGSSAPSSGASTPGPGSAPPGVSLGASPASPGAVPQAALPGTVSISTAPLGTPPTNSGLPGTPPVNADASILFGPKPTSGGPGIR